MGADCYDAQQVEWLRTFGGRCSEIEKPKWIRFWEKCNEGGLSHLPVSSRSGEANVGPADNTADDLIYPLQLCQLAVSFLLPIAVYRKNSKGKTCRRPGSCPLPGQL